MNNVEAQPLVADPARCVGIPQESNASGISSRRIQCQQISEMMNTRGKQKRALHEKNRVVGWMTRTPTTDDLKASQRLRRQPWRPGHRGQGRPPPPPPLFLSGPAPPQAP